MGYCKKKVMDNDNYSGNILTNQNVLIRGWAHFKGGVIWDISNTKVSCWNRVVPLYTEVSSFQGAGIEWFHFIQRCPHFRVLE